jgi:hypothetical protein
MANSNFAQGSAALQSWRVELYASFRKAVRQFQRVAGIASEAVKPPDHTFIIPAKTVENFIEFGTGGLAPAETSVVVNACASRDLKFIDPQLDVSISRANPRMRKNLHMVDLPGSRQRPFPNDFENLKVRHIVETKERRRMWGLSHVHALRRCVRSKDPLIRLSDLIQGTLLSQPSR